MKVTTEEIYISYIHNFVCNLMYELFFIHFIQTILSLIWGRSGEDGTSQHLCIFDFIMEIISVLSSII